MRILVASDGSESAGVAVDLVASVAWPAGSTIHVVEAVAAGPLVFGGPWPPMPPNDAALVDEQIREYAEQHLVEAKARLTASGLPVETSFVAGRTADVILSLAEETEADVIVVGSRGHGALERMLLGSVSSEVVDHAHVPVLVARGRAVDRVVYAWDGSACAEQGAHVLTDWGIFAASGIHVISVADASPAWWADPGTTGAGVAAKAYDEAAEPSRRQYEELARAMAHRLGEAGLKAEPQRRDGDAAEQIVRAADVWGADLVIVGTHGRTGLRRLLMGSVARNVLHHVDCSVLIVRACETLSNESASA